MNLCVKFVALTVWQQCTGRNMVRTKTRALKTSTFAFMVRTRDLSSGNPAENSLVAAPEHERDGVNLIINSLAAKKQIERHDKRRRRMNAAW